jgi:hypothetical protein
MLGSKMSRGGCIVRSAGRSNVRHERCWRRRREGRRYLLAAVCAVEISIVDVCEGGGLEFGVFHGPTLPPAGCGLLLYKSYSLGTERILYKADAAAGTAKTMRKIGASSLIE